MVTLRASILLAALGIGCGSSGDDDLFGEGSGQERVDGSGSGGAGGASLLPPPSGGGASTGGHQGVAGAPGQGSGGASEGGLPAEGGRGSGGVTGAPADAGADATGGASSSSGGGGPDAGDGCAEVRFFEDQDGDGFGNAKRPVFACVIREGLVVNDDDCYDGNALAFPGQTAPLEVDRGDGSFDYDCDGEGRRELTVLGRCGTFPFCTGVAGWRGAAPACGKAGTWLPACVGLTTICQQPTEAKSQRCL